MPNNNITFDLALRIANAANFFDTARSALDDRGRTWGGIHVDHLHAAAQLLAGELNAYLYAPHDASFVEGQLYATEVMIDHSNTLLRLSHCRDRDGGVSLCLRTNSGHLYLLPTECRALAATLKQLADDGEASAAQHEIETPVLSKVAT